MQDGKEMRNEPVMCHLSDDEFRERERSLLERFRKTVADRREHGEGYVYGLPLSQDSLELLTELILLEKDCCRFLDFSISVKSGNEYVSLQLSGPPGAKEVIKEIFN